MKPELIEDQVAQQGWVDPAEKALDSLSRATVNRAGSLIRRFLHGSWLGHPLHPAVVTVPIGAFTTATTLDLLDTAQGTRKYEAGAEVAVGLGLATATLAAASGLADWSHSEGAGRRVGVLHAACNGGATLCYLASWFLRRHGDRAAATSTGLLGWLLLMAGGYLGGRMVDNHKLGVDHADRHGPEDFHPVFPLSELPENEPHRAELNGVGVLVVRQHGKIFALGEKCAHLGGPLSEGKLEDGAIRCPWHGSKYDLETGRVLDGPSAFSQPCWEARVQNGQVEIRFVKKNW
jgi:nitrite reductase/ring-hydroxylating ferredoxin subunit/uncharacterized membrane protein